MSKRQFKSQASSSRAASGIGFGGFGSAATTTTLSYLVEPPNLSSINDAHVVVALKNLSKKDGTTKAKALEDLRAYVQTHPFEQDGGVEEPVIEAWVKFYPRVSIDNSRRVRELSHHLQVELLKSARKRMEKYIPKVVGSWLAGTFDRDRAVARAAKDGITSFLDTDTKVLLFWKRCQVQILDYAQEAINETPQTLSDERTMSADDIQAKYFRVVSSSISLVLNLLIILNGEDISKHQDKYEEYLAANKKLWSLAAAEDSFVRKTVDRLLVVCLAKQPSLVENELELLSQSFITDALRVTQASSSIELLQALSSLTSKHPTVWTTSYKSKKAPISRLRGFVEKGSQGGPPEFWQILQSLLRALPAGVLPSDLASMVDFLQAFRKGISNRTEPRSNAAGAWSSYFNISMTLAENSSSSTPTGKLYDEAVFPVFEQYLYPTAENSQWNVGNAAVLARAYEICSSVQDQETQTFCQGEWTRLADGFVGRLRTSLPEQSKDYHKSQAAIISESQRWFGLLHELIRTTKDAGLNDYAGSPSSKIIEAALDVMTNRNGKPYSAAATIETSLRLAPRVMEDGSLLQLVESRLKDNIEMLIVSPSWEYIVSIIFFLSSIPSRATSSRELWQAAVNGVLSQAAGVQKTKTVTKLISHDSTSKTVQTDRNLQKFISDTVNGADDASPETWTLLEAALTFDALADKTMDNLLQQALLKLDMTGSVLDAALKTLEILAKKNHELLKSHETHITLINKLLTLTELSDSVVVSRAAALRSVIENSTQTGQTGSEQIPVLHVIRENLETASKQSLTIQTLVEQAKAVMANSTSPETSAALLPERSQWSKALEPLLGLSPNPSLGVMRPFAGAVFLVHGSSATLTSGLPRDIKGYSVALRMAMYTSLLASEDNFALVPRDTQVDMFYLLCLTTELARDQIDVLEEDRLFLSHRYGDIVDGVQEFLSQSQRCLALMIDTATTWRQKPAEDTHDSGAVIHELFSKLLRASSSSSPEAYYSSKTLSHLVSRLVDVHGWHSEEGEEWLLSLDIFKPSTSNVLGATAIIIGLEEQLVTSKLVSNFCNRLISDVAGASPQSDKTLRLLVLLNATLTVYDIGDIPVAQNRLVFAVKQILSWTEELVQVSTELSSEACRALHKLLPAIKEVYGTYWENTISFLLSIWGSCSDGSLSDERLPMIGMSLKLYSILSSLEEANDDLDDALLGSKDLLSRSLVNLLKLRRSKESQPLRFVDDLLSRVVVSLPTTGTEDVTEFYSLVASDFRMVQSAAYHVLHEALPKTQQQISVDILLDNKDARLPEELLSLLLDAPSIHDFSDEELSDFPSSIRGYLLSWHLVFDSYLNASYKVRNDYTESLKSENYIGPLLSFLFDVLGHSEAKPMNLDKSRFGPSTIQEYDMWRVVDSETSDRDMQQLLLNLYYLALKFVPNLVKTWWFDCKSKQTSIAVDSWTEKFFSPLVIQDTLEDVERWAEEQEAPADDEKDLIIRVSKKSREIFAAYEVDDMMMQIAIRLPANYPLEGVKVDGINRVAVSEKKWTSWLMITQGVITFSNGSITDGLAIFRKNVTGALKGQTECAICYSIISSDKKMPDKRCQTCKNLFHSSCLFKWFASSNQSTCPLCRNSFNYGTDTTRRARERDQAGMAR